MSDEKSQKSSGDQSPNIHSVGGAVNITYNNKDAILEALPKYLEQLLALLTAPRRFFSSRVEDARRLLVQGLTFLILSTLIGYCLRIPAASISAGDWLQKGVVTTISYALSAILLGLIAFACCRLMSGKSSLRVHLGMFVYMAGFSVVAFAVVTLLRQGLMLVLLEDQFPLYQEYMSLVFSDPDQVKELRFKDLDKGWQMKASMLVMGLGTLGISIWIANAWRAFGDVNKLSGGRVALSLCLFLFLGYWANRFLGLLQDANGIGLL